MINQSKTTTYLDEISDNPALATDLAINTYKLNSICLRRVWTGNITTLNDIALNQLKSSLGNLKVLMIASDLGAQTIKVTDTEFERPFLISNYFGARYLRVHIGNSHEHDLQEAWIKKVGDRSIRANITPLYEYNPDYGNITADDILNLLNFHPRWKILYDASSWIVRRNLDPYIKYWTHLKDKVAIIDIKDYRIGQGFRPCGLGDCRLKETIAEASTILNTIHFALEPSLGYRYNTAMKREEVFKLAWDQMIEYLK